MSSADRKAEVLLTRGRVRLVSVPYKEDETDQQKQNPFDVWKDKAAPREIKLEVSDGNDLLGRARWKEIEWWREQDFARPLAMTIVADLVGMLADTGILGETVDDRIEALEAEVRLGLEQHSHGGTGKPLAEYAAAGCPDCKAIVAADDKLQEHYQRDPRPMLLDLALGGPGGSKR